VTLSPRVQVDMKCRNRPVEGRWYGLIQRNDVAHVEVLDEGMQVLELEVETAAGVVAALWVRKGDRSLSNGKIESSSGTHELVFVFHGRESLELLLLSLLSTLLLAESVLTMPGCKREWGDALCVKLKWRVGGRAGHGIRSRFQLACPPPAMPTSARCAPPWAVCKERRGDTVSKLT